MFFLALSLFLAQDGNSPGVYVLNALWSSSLTPSLRFFFGRVHCHWLVVCFLNCCQVPTSSPWGESHHLYWRFGSLQILQGHIDTLSFALCSQMANHNHAVDFTSLILGGALLVQGFVFHVMSTPRKCSLTQMGQRTKTGSGTSWKSEPCLRCFCQFPMAINSWDEPLRERSERKKYAHGQSFALTARQFSSSL